MNQVAIMYTSKLHEIKKETCIAQAICQVLTLGVHKQNFKLQQNLWCTKLWLVVFIDQVKVELLSLKERQDKRILQIQEDNMNSQYLRMEV